MYINNSYEDFDRLSKYYEKRHDYEAAKQWRERAFDKYKEDRYEEKLKEDMYRNYGHFYDD